MRKIKPYPTLHDAIRALDNGGRFYNLFTRPADDLIEPAELARAARTFSADAIAFLYFDIALMALTPNEQARLLSMFSPELAARYDASRPRHLAPAAAESVARPGQPVILSGHAVLVRDRTQLRNILVKVGPATVTPISDQADLYEVFATSDSDPPRALVAVPRRTPDLDRTVRTFGGILQEYILDAKSQKKRGLYLQAAYYTPRGPQRP